MTHNSPADSVAPRSPLWLRALTVLSLLVFGLGLLLTLLRVDLTALLSGLFSVTRARGALVILLLASALAAIILGRATGRRRRLLQVVAYGGVLVAAIGVWFDKTPYGTSPVSYTSRDAQ